MYKRMKLFNCAHFLNIFLDFFLKNHPSLYLEYNVLYIYYLALDNQSSIWVKHHQVSVGNKKKRKKVKLFDLNKKFCKNTKKILFSVLKVLFLLSNMKVFDGILRWSIDFCWCIVLARTFEDFNKLLLSTGRLLKYLLLVIPCSYFQ